MTDRRQLSPSKLAGAAAAVWVAIGLAAAASWLLLVVPDRWNVLQSMQFAGSTDRLREGLARGDQPVELGDLRAAMLAGAAATLVWAAALHFSFTGSRRWPRKQPAGFWEHAWKAAPGTTIRSAWLGNLAMAGGGVGLLAHLVMFGGVSVPDDGAEYRWISGEIVLILAWVQWLVYGLCFVLVVMMLVSLLTAARRRRIDGEPEPQPASGTGQSPAVDTPATAAAGVGICCSGGGIRSAAFSLGGLSALELAGGDDKPLGILGHASYLASVSGGGYAAAAWRIAAGTGELPPAPIIGRPDDPARRLRRYPDPTEPAADLVQHIRERRRFLGNGRGGVPTAALNIAFRTALHVSLLLIAVFTVAWPLGRLLVTWPITAVGRQPTALDTGIAIDLDAHLWLPPLAILALAVVAWSPRLFLDRSPQRRLFDLAAAALFATAIALAVVLLALPAMVDGLVEVLDAIPRGGLGKFAVAGIYGTVLSWVWSLAKRRVAAAAKYLGGVLLAVALLVFALVVMAHAADTDALFSGWLWPVGTFAVLAWAMVTLNPDGWSVHPIYRSRLAGTFVTERRVDGIRPGGADLPLDAYADAKGPEPIVCCAAARKSSQYTGIPVLSMTFDTAGVTVHAWPEGLSSNARPEPKTIDHDRFRARLPQRGAGARLDTLMGAAAVSGAAVAPSLGRMSLRSTNALLAAVNARLGVWLPNPAATEFTNETTPKLVNMFKEIFGLFDENDPNVYATDGGHWENLGLVELIRRKCSTIICLDASGDSPGTYSTFKQAIKLAALECGAVITMPDRAWRLLAIDADGVSRRNYGLASVTYSDGSTGQVLYVKAAIMAATSFPIQRYASADRTFPHYSTGDQFLTDEEISHLMQLGFESVEAALRAHQSFGERALTE